MNQLVEQDVQMTSLDIAEVTGKRHDNVMRDIRNEVESLGKEISLLIFEESTYTNSRGKELPCYTFGKKGAMQLALKYDAVTRYKVIERIEELENRTSKEQLVQQFNLPKNYSEALHELAEYVGENEQLKQQIENDKEKVVLANAVTSSDEGLLIEAAAKYMRQNGVNIGRDRLFKWLRNQGYLINRKGREWNMPTQRSIEQGLMKVHNSLHYDSEGELKSNRQVVVTGKGLLFYINKFLHDGQLALELEG